MPRCAEIQYRTRTRTTRFGKPAGFPVPVTIPKENHCPFSAAYINAIIEKYGFADAKILSILADPHIQLTKDQLPQTSEDILTMSKNPYAEAVALLNYASIAPCPNITFIVG
jgi:hypothetical protein